MVILMNNDSFARLVAEEVKNKAQPEQCDYLRLPENWDRWRQALLALLNNLDSQLHRLSASENKDRTLYSALGESGANLLDEAMSDYESRRKKIERFKFHVDARLDEVSRMIALGEDEIDDKFKSIEFLRRAIYRHKELMVKMEMEPSAIDNALWATLDGKWLFEDIDLENLDLAVD